MKTIISKNTDTCRLRLGGLQHKPTKIWKATQRFTYNVNTWTWGNFYYVQQTNFDMSWWFWWMQTNVFTLRSHVSHHIIGVTASAAAWQSPNQGKGCGRLAEEHTQLLSFYLRRKEEDSKHLQSSPPSCLHISTYLQTSVREERSRSPSLLEWRDTSRTRCPEGEKCFSSAESRK